MNKILTQEHSFLNSKTSKTLPVNQKQLIPSHRYSANQINQLLGMVEIKWREAAGK